MTRSAANSVHCHPLEKRCLRSATLYVSPSGSDDNGNGSLASPYATLQHAANLTNPGDTVIAEPGQYAGFVLGWDNPQGGAPGAPITYRAMPGASIVSRDNKTPDGIDLEPGNNYVNLIGFTLTNTGGTITRAAIRVCGSDFVNIIRNDCDGAGEWGIFTSHSNYTLIENNITSHSIRQHGIYVSNSAQYPTIIGNTVFGNADCGIHLNGDLSEGGNGLITNAFIAFNTIYDNGALGGSAINGDGLTNSLIENNLLYDNHASGISLFQSDASAGASGNTIANNTIVMASDARWDININSASTGNTVFNNILLNANPSHGAIDITSDSLSGFSSDNNLTDSRFAIDDNPMTIADWKSQTQQDAQSILTIENPFASATDFHLADGSPAAGIGQAFLAQGIAPTSDMDGNARLPGHIDAGAFQLDFATQPDPANPLKLDWIARGTPGDDSIALTQTAPGVVMIQMNGIDRGTLPTDALANIQICGAAGNDTITSTADVGIPLLIRGGAGADSIVGATDNDTLAGGRGNDTLIATGDSSWVTGGKGQDLLTGAPSDTLIGNSAVDTLLGGAALAA